MNRLKKGDDVIVIAGKDKGRRGNMVTVAVAAREANLPLKVVRSGASWGQFGAQRLHEKLYLVDLDEVLAYARDRAKRLKNGRHG